MARRKAERQRMMEEEDDDLQLPWITRREFETLTYRQQSREYQKFTQPAMTYLGCHKTCKLPVCRRAKACKGFLSEAQYGRGYHGAFPPCMGEGAPLHQQALHAMDTDLGRRPPSEDGPKYSGNPSDQIPQSDEPR